MTATAIRFEDHALPNQPDPTRMDVTCFFGLIAERSGAVVPQSVRDELRRFFGDSDAKPARAGPLLNRPVTIRNVAEFEALYNADARVEARAVVRGGDLPDGLPTLGVSPTLFIVIDGEIHEIDLTPLPATPAALVERIAAAGLRIEVSLGSGPRPALTMALPLSHGAGSLTVLPYPSLGFPDARRASARTVPSVMAQAVRQFFASGGRQAVIVRMGDPLPYDSTREERRAALIRIVVEEPEQAELSHEEALAALSTPLLEPVADAQFRYGPAHAYGLADTTFLCLPDLPELVAPRPGLTAMPAPVPEPEATFAECLPDPSPGGQAAASSFLAPVADAESMVLWSAVIDRMIGMLRQYERDKFLVAALPRLTNDATTAAVPHSAFLQVAEGWLVTAFSQLAPEGLMPPDSVLAGHLARSTLRRGTFLSAASLPLSALRSVETKPASGIRTVRIFRHQGTFRLSGDYTTSADPVWTDGPVARLMALLLRQAREIGQSIVFEPSGPSLWARITASMEGLLEAVRAAGALAGEGPPTSYSVRCDTTTMTQDDLDNGRLIAEVRFRPTIPVQSIVVRLPITGDRGQVIGVGGPA
ncbi:phage tail sheath family protein [Microvirga pakistanensis]|uniref:phage tail sheath family protein n=1 Tax=Microvirga pakistanensis TaxID=1682650 RepID=UPI001069CC05|nr:phage tail sheath family protein [Microvirga pakistanensis]